MDNLFISRALRIIIFCSAGTFASPTSTAKSPRATIRPSEASRISSKFGMASARSIFAIKSASPPALRINSRAIYISALVLGKDTARKSASNSAAVMMSAMSLAVKAAAESPPPSLLMPLRSESLPPCSTTHSSVSWVTSNTRMRILPSSNNKISSLTTSLIRSGKSKPTRSSSPKTSA